ncbi:major facilitator superfamily transporter [Stemphylium lycopersici]|nr:major facilitator superfamily transporter [Stemphylium lycopersici]
MALMTYTTRDVTFTCDILRAFEGVSAVLSEAMQTDFWQGIPENILPLALCWQLQGRFRRRETELDGETASSMLFPSWSWAGWDCAVDLNEFIPICGCKNEAEWFIINHNAVATRLRVEPDGTSKAGDSVKDTHDDLSGHGKSPSESAMMKDMLPRVVPRSEVDVASPDWRDARMLGCFTTCASFVLDRTQHVVSSNRHERMWPRSHIFAIKDAQGITAGCILLPKHFFKRRRVHRLVCEFIAISKSLPQRYWEKPKEMRYFDDSVYGARNEDRSWVVNAMMIGRLEDNRAFRIAVGVIHEDAWRSAAPEATFVKLVYTARLCRLALIRPVNKTLSRMQNMRDIHLVEEELPSPAVRALIWKQDLRIIPLAAGIYLLCFLDRSNIGNAKTLNAAAGHSLLQEAHMSNYQFTISLMVFLVAYAVFEVPSNVLLKKLKPSRWIAFLMFGWGACTIGLGGANNYATVTAVRFLLGMFEAGLFPGLVFYLTFWYRASERSMRVAIILASATLAGAFGGAIAYGVGHMKMVQGLAAWRWLFILEGIPSCVSSIAVWLILPDYPEEASWLSTSERELAVTRLETEGSKGNAASLSWETAKETLLDGRLWVHYIIYFGISAPFSSLSLFTPTITAGLGYENLQAQLMTVPPYAVAYEPSAFWLQRFFRPTHITRVTAASSLQPVAHSPASRHYSVG